MKRLLPLLVTDYKRAICALGLGVLLMGPYSAMAQDAKGTQVFVYEVSERSFSNTLQALGTLRANEAATISASVTDTVTAVHFDDGQRVKKGDVLIEMTSGEETAMLESAQHTLREAEQQYERVKSLVPAKLATQSQLDAQRLNFESAKSNLEATRSRLRDLLILAPFDGVVGMRNISAGALVRPGDVITTLDDDSVMKLDMAVPSTYLPYLQNGMVITAVAHAMGGQKFVGEIGSIGSRIDPVTRSVQVRAHIPNPDRLLRPGLLMVVELEEPPRQAIVIPEKALVQNAANRYVFVVKEGEKGTIAERRQVQIGERQPGVIEITSGLALGELIVSHGHLKLKDGSELIVSARDTGSDKLGSLLRAGDRTSKIQAID